MGFGDDVCYGVKNLMEGIANGEVFRDIGEIATWAGKSFITDVLQIGVDKRIDRETAVQELEDLIQNKLADGDYSSVNIGLTAEVSDVRYRSGSVKVDFDVSYDDDCADICRVQMNSEYGTDLEVGDRLKLTL